MRYLRIDWSITAEDHFLTSQSVRARGLQCRSVYEMRAKSTKHTGWVSRPSSAKEPFLSSLWWPQTGTWPTLPRELSWPLATSTEFGQLFFCLWGPNQIWTCGPSHVPSKVCVGPGWGTENNCKKLPSKCLLPVLWLEAPVTSDAHHSVVWGQASHSLSQAANCKLPGWYCGYWCLNSMVIILECCHTSASGTSAVLCFCVYYFISSLNNHFANEKTKAPRS